MVFFRCFSACRGARPEWCLRAVVFNIECNTRAVWEIRPQKRKCWTQCSSACWNQDFSLRCEKCLFQDFRTEWQSPSNIFKQGTSNELHHERGHRSDFIFLHVWKYGRTIFTVQCKSEVMSPAIGAAAKSASNLLTESYLTEPVGPTWGEQSNMGWRLHWVAQLGEMPQPVFLVITILGHARFDFDNFWLALWLWYMPFTN